MKRDWITLGVVAGLLLLVFSAMGAVPVVWTLLTGWLGYLQRVLPKVTVNWPGVGLAAVCVALIAGIGHHLAAWVWRGGGYGSKWKFRWTAAALATLVLMFAAGTAAVGIAHQTAWLVRGPAPLFESFSKRRALRVRCTSNLRQIHSALLLYARQHGGQYPQRLEELVEAGLIDSAEVFVCPNSRDEKAVGATTKEWAAQLSKREHLSYVYVPEAFSTTDSPPTASARIILYEHLENHEGEGMNVCYDDGRIEFFSAHETRLFLATLPRTRPAQ